jgi:PHD/YefM family antitoxin component YafN of YafNO toxin-antitoxin module
MNMAVTLKSSEVQQNFGRVIDQALVEDGVIVERYGEPRAAILSYHRYQQLIQIEAESQQPHLTPPDDSPEAQQRGQALAAEIRQQLRDKLDGSLEEVMASLRGRSWSS